jgi:hypothetical protein
MTAAGSDQKPPTRKRRKQGDTLKSYPAEHGADRFVEELASRTGKGAITDAAQAAYPNQTRAAASVTGSRLLKNAKIAERIQMRREAAAQAAGTSRQQVIEMLLLIAFTSLRDFQNEDTGQFDWALAAELGIDHVVQEEEITERHNEKTGASRITRKYKIPNKLAALDLLSDLCGWKKQASRNPIDAAREIFAIQRRKPRYADVADEVLAQMVAEAIPNVTVADILG